MARTPKRQPTAAAVVEEALTESAPNGSPANKGRKRALDQATPVTPRSSKRLKTGSEQAAAETPVPVADKKRPQKSHKESGSRDTVPPTSSRNSKARTATTLAERDASPENKVDCPPAPSPKRKQQKSKKSTSKQFKGEQDLEADFKAEEDSINAPEVEPQKKKRKTKAEKLAEAMPIAARTADPLIFVGAHVSAAGGVHNAISNAVHIGANAFALFLKSQRKWENPALQDHVATAFGDGCKKDGFKATAHVVPHGSYLVNLAQPEPTKAKQAYDSFLDDLKRCETLGVTLYNFHPGNTNGEPRAEAIGRIAQRLNQAHRETKTVVTLLENMAAGPTTNTIGGAFEDLRDVISLVNDKSRVGVCFDTCHGFAAGHDLRTPEAFKQTFAKFDQIVGGQYLKAVHMNDSKAPFNSNRDLHYNIGLGFLGLRAFHTLINDERFHGIPLVLETPIDRKDENGKVVEDKSVWAREIKLLESLHGMDAESAEFQTLEADLWAQGAKERARLQDQHDRKVASIADKLTSPRKRKKKAIEVDTDRDDSDG